MGGCAGCGPSPEDLAAFAKEVDRTQRFPGVDQQRKNVTPTGGAPGYRVRWVNELPPQGQAYDVVYSQQDRALCVWDVQRQEWVCATPGAGAICADFLIIECWAQVVADGLGVEGQLFDSFGCDVRIVSTAQLAYDGHAGDATHATFTGMKDFGTNVIAKVCNSNAGPLNSGADNGQTAFYMKFIGEGDAQISSWTDAAGSKFLMFDGIYFVGSAGTRPINKTSGRSWDLYRCTAGGPTTQGPRIYSGAGQANECSFPVNQAGEYSLDMTSNAFIIRLIDCAFSDRVRVGSECYFIDPIHYLGNSGIGVVGGSVDAQNPQFRTSGASFVHYYDLNDILTTFNIIGVRAVAGCTGAAVEIGTSFAANGSRSTLTGSFNCDLILENLSGTELYVDVDVNRSIVSGRSNQQTKIAVGKFNNSSFWTGGPKDYVDFTTFAGMVNQVNGVQVGLGTPTHIGVEGEHYVDWTANLEYINCSDRFGTCWSVIGAYGPGSPVISSHSHPAVMPLPIVDDWEQFDQIPTVVPGPKGDTGATGAIGPPGTGTGGGGAAMPLAIEAEDAEATIMVPPRMPVLTRELWLIGWIPTTTTGAGNPEIIEVGSTTKHDWLASPFDSSTAESAFHECPMPYNWDGLAVTFHVWWLCKSGFVSTSSDGTAWGLKATAYAHGDPTDTVFGTEVVSTGTGDANNDVNKSAESAALTIGNTPLAGELVHWVLTRKTADAADDWAADAYPIAVVVTYGVNQSQA